MSKTGQQCQIDHHHDCGQHARVPRRELVVWRAAQQSQKDELVQAHTSHASQAAVSNELHDVRQEAHVLAPEHKFLYCRFMQIDISGTDQEQHEQKYSRDLGTNFLLIATDRQQKHKLHSTLNTAERAFIQQPR